MVDDQPAFVAAAFTPAAPAAHPVLTAAHSMIAIDFPACGFGPVVGPSYVGTASNFVNEDWNADKSVPEPAAEDEAPDDGAAAAPVDPPPDDPEPHAAKPSTPAVITPMTGNQRLRRPPHTKPDEPILRFLSAWLISWLDNNFRDLVTARLRVPGPSPSSPIIGQ
jgi:hypothetical protein